MATQLHDRRPRPTHPVVLGRYGGHPVPAGIASLRPAAAIGSIVPAAVFLAFDRWQGLVPAMIAASVASLAAIVLRRQNGNGLGLLLPISLAYTAVKAVAGILTASQVVYFGAGLVLSALLALAVGATAFTRRPAASYLLPLVTPYRHVSPSHPVHRNVSAHVTAAWATAELAVTGWEAWHLTTATASEFVAIRTVMAWPAMAVLIFLLIAYARFRLDPYERLHDRATVG